jgi:hypothetical protein
LIEPHNKNNNKNIDISSINDIDSNNDNNSKDQTNNNNYNSEDLFEFSSEGGDGATMKELAAFLLPVVRITHLDLFGGSNQVFDAFLRIVFVNSNVTRHPEHWVVTKKNYNIIISCSESEILLLLPMEDIESHAAAIIEGIGPKMEKYCALVEFGRNLL